MMRLVASLNRSRPRGPARQLRLPSRSGKEREREREREKTGFQSVSRSVSPLAQLSSPLSPLLSSPLLGGAASGASAESSQAASWGFLQRAA